MKDEKRFDFKKLLPKDVADRFARLGNDPNSSGKFIEVNQKKIILGKALEWQLGMHNAIPKVIGDFILDLNFLRTHLCIFGDTGSGKTTTTLQIIKALYESSTPFWVLECAKKEYRNIKSICPNVLIFTPGVETITPFRFNFLEVPKNVHVQTHIEHIVSAFEHVYDMPHPLPLIFRKAIINLYKKKGWNIVRNKPPQDDEDDIYPRPSMLADEVYQVLEERKAEGKGYEGEIASNIPSALFSRIDDSLQAGRGKMYDCKKSIPLAELFGKNVIFELQDIGDDREKKFFAGLLLASFSEFLSRMGNSDKLRHVIIIEEAHRILGNSTGPVAYSNSMGQNTSQIVTDLVTESRSLGEGIILIDQLPERLPPEAIKIARSAIIHQLKSKESIDYVCNQFNTLSRLPELGYPNLKLGEAIVVISDNIYVYPVSEFINPNQHLFLARFTRPTETIKNIPDETIISDMECFYNECPWIREITDYEDLLMGIKPFEVDQICAISEFDHLIKNNNPKNPYLLQNKKYPIDVILTPEGREIRNKFLTPEAGERIAKIRKSLEGIKIIDFEKADNQEREAFFNTYKYIMHFAVKGLQKDIIPLPLITYFLRILVFNYLDFELEKNSEIFSELIKLLAISGWYWIKLKKG